MNGIVRNRSIKINKATPKSGQRATVAFCAIEGVVANRLAEGLTIRVLKPNVFPKIIPK